MYNTESFCSFLFRGYVIFSRTIAHVFKMFPLFLVSMLPCNHDYEVFLRIAEERFEITIYRDRVRSKRSDDILKRRDSGVA